MTPTHTSMTSIDEAFADGRRLVLYAGATAFVAGVFLVGIGALSVAYDAISAAASPASAVLWAPTVAGLGLAVCLAAANRLLGGAAAARFTAAGLALSVLAVVLVWALAPAAPPETGAAAIAVPAAVYVLGTLALLAGFFSVALRSHERPSGSAVSLGSNVGASVTDPTVADGGDDERWLSFPLDRDDEDDGPDRL